MRELFISPDRQHRLQFHFETELFMGAPLMGVLTIDDTITIPHVCHSIVFRNDSHYCAFPMLQWTRTGYANDYDRRNAGIRIAVVDLRHYLIRCVGQKKSTIPWVTVKSIKGHTVVYNECDVEKSISFGKVNWNNSVTSSWHGKLRATLSNEESSTRL